MHMATRWRRLACLPLVASLVLPVRLAGYGAAFGAASSGLIPAMCEPSVTATPKVLSRDSRHQAQRGTWTVQASVACLAPHQRLELSVRLFRNGRAEPQVASQRCLVSATTPVCQQMSVDATWSYAAMAGSWSATVVTFTLGPTSMLQWQADDHCELDIPSLIVGCTYPSPLETIR
jgi:hypothetical protein